MQIADLGQTVTTTNEAVNESHILASETGRNASWINGSVVYTLTNNPTNWKVDDCPITAFVLKNNSGTVLTETTDYVLTASAGTFVFVDNALLNNTINMSTNETLATYEYCSDEYLNLGWGRTVIDLVPGFFAIALLLVSIGLFYSVGKETGIIN